MSKRLLYIGHVWPEPRSSAAGGRTVALMRAFVEAGWDTTFASAAEPGERAEGVDAIASAIASIELNDDSFDRFVTRVAPDAVVFDRFMVEEQFGWRVEKHCPDAMRILDTVDLHCLRRVREANPTDPTHALLESEDAKREIASIYRSDLTLVISRYEMGLLQSVFGVSAALLHYVPFMISAEELERPLIPFESRRHFATIGNFLHAPNRDSVHWLRSELWPRIRELMPSAEIRVYGSYLPHEIEQLDDRDQGFRVLGWVPDVRSALEQVRILLAPLRAGAGLKGKIVDAMVAGTPVVTTAIGAEGMEGDDEGGRGRDAWCGLVAEDATSIAQAGVELHSERERWRFAQRRGREIAASEFDAVAHARNLLERVETGRDNLTENRRCNFIGAMLRHHHHRSTEFMARWIEAKNRSNGT